jgi:GT2 family glycosyltransferase
VKPTVSIILVTYNSAQHLPTCVAALRSLRYDPPPQIIIVDNASEDNSVTIAKQLLPEALLLPQPHNLGFGGGVNLGVAASNGECIALLNPDTRVSVNWLTPLIEALEAPECGIAGSKILDAQEKTLLHTGGEVTRPTILTNHRGEGELDQGQYDLSEKAPFLTGASLALRRDIWDRLNGFDVGFFPGYFEDVDLCWRTHDLGLECHYIPQSTLTHIESASTGKFSGTYYYYFHRNRLRFACKHLAWAELWADFGPAEALRLRHTSALDRMVASLVYRQSLPRGLALPTTEERATILATGRVLSAISAECQNKPDSWPLEVQNLLGMPANDRSHLPRLLREIERDAVLREHVFQSPWQFVARLRQLWNNVATRWYVLPVLHQQSRVNLAVQRSISELEMRIESQHALLETQVRQALLCFRLGTMEAQSWNQLQPMQ